MRVAVVGAGWAGLAAAVESTARGHAVTLFERAPTLGGRARRVHWSIGGQRVPIDNGQHILIGAYRETLALMARLEVDASAALQRLPLRIEYADGPSIRAPRWPAPLHLAAALLGARGLRWRTRVQALSFSAWARARGWRLDADCTVRALLRARGMDAEAVALLWAPLCLAALNTPIEQASAQVFLNVLRDSLGAARADSDLLLPRTDLSAVLPDAAGRWLPQRGASVRVGAAGAIDAIAPDGPAGWRLRAGQAWHRFDAVVLATGPRDAAGLLGRAIDASVGVAGADARGGAAWGSLQALRALEPSAIATAWMLLPDGTHWRRPMHALRADRPDSPAQWLFVREARPVDDRRLVGAVLSAPAVDALDRDVLRARLLAQVGREFAARARQPAARVAPADSPVKIVVEREATFLCTPALRRPPLSTGLPRLWLAGDYTDGPYPGTLESAVRSGLAVAGAIGSRPGGRP